MTKISPKRKKATPRNEAEEQGTRDQAAREQAARQQRDTAKLQALWPGLDLIAASKQLALHRTPQGVKVRRLSGRDGNPSRLTNKEVRQIHLYMTRYTPEFDPSQKTYLNCWNEHHNVGLKWIYVAINPGLADIPEELLSTWMLTTSRRQVWRRLAPGLPDTKLPNSSKVRRVKVHRILRGIFPTVHPEQVGALSVKVDDITKLANPELAPEYTTNLRVLSTLFGGPTPFVQMLIHSQVDLGNAHSTVTDTLKMLTLVGEHAGTRTLEFRTLHELHDGLVVICREENLIGKGVQFPVNPAYEQSIAGFTFRPMHGSADAISTGDRLNICVGYAGYSERAQQGQITLLTVSDLNLQACVELSGGQIKQFKLHRNATPVPGSALHRAAHCFAALHNLNPGNDLAPLNLRAEYRDAFGQEPTGPHWTEWLQQGAPTPEPLLAAAPLSQTG